MSSRALIAAAAVSTLLVGGLAGTAAAETPRPARCGGALTAVDIGEAPERGSRANDLNDRGDVVGALDPGYTEHRDRPFRWRDGTLTVLDKGGFTFGTAVATNNRGQILGVARYERYRLNYTVLWDPDGNPTRLYPGDEDGRAYDLNERGHALVLAGDLGLGVWRPGGFTAIPVPAGRRITEATALNERDQAIGRSDVAEGFGTIDAWVWDGRRNWEIGSPLGGQYDSTVATALNNRGQVVGYSVREAPTGPQGVSWLWERGRQTVLTSPAGHFTASDIDDRGRILGTVDTATGRRAVIREPGGRWRDLGRFGLTGTDGEVQPLALNNRGQALVYTNPGPYVDTDTWLWDRGRATALPLPAGVQYATPPADLNERGEAIAQLTLPNYQSHAVVWTRRCPATPQV